MSGLSPQAYGFVNRIRSLHNLDRDDVSFLASGQWVQFRDNPVDFLIHANDATAAAICAAVEARQPAAEPMQGTGGHWNLIQALSRLADSRHSDGSSSLVSCEDRNLIISGCYDLMLSAHSAGLKERPEDPYNCPVCALPLKAGDTCATDIELGTCHAACLEGSPTVNLDTGEPVDGLIPTYPYEPDQSSPAQLSGGGLSRLRAWIWEQREKHDEDLVALSPAFDLILNKIDEFDDLPVHWLTYMLARFPLGKHCTIEHDGFAGAVCGYYCRDDGKLGVNLQLDGAKVVHVYGEKWLGGGNG